MKILKTILAVMVPIGAVYFTGWTFHACPDTEYLGGGKWLEPDWWWLPTQFLCLMLSLFTLAGVIPALACIWGDR
jgi:hypothetical protein